MPKRASVFNQLLLPFMYGTAQKSSAHPEHDQLAILPQRRISHSGFQSLSTCPRQYFLSGPGAYQGWRADAPLDVRTNYQWKNIQNTFAWIGTLFHELTTVWDFSAIDETEYKRSGVLPLYSTKASEEERFHVGFSLFRDSFNRGWEESASQTWHAYLGDPKRKEKVFLIDHARRSRSLNFKRTLEQEFSDLKERDRLWEWLCPSVECFLRSRSQLYQGSGPLDWVMIEGLVLQRGLIVQDPEESKSQRILRSQSAYPTITLDVDGESWLYGYVIDRLLYVPQEKMFYLMDFKTGKKKDIDVTQLKQYAAFLLTQYKSFMVQGKEIPIGPDNLKIRLLYLKFPADERYVEDWVSKEEIPAFLEEARNQLRQLRSRLIPVERCDETMLRTVLPEALIKGPFAPGDRLAIGEMFPPAAARELRVETCARCDRRDRCTEGQALIALQV